MTDSRSDWRFRAVVFAAVAGIGCSLGVLTWAGSRLMAVSFETLDLQLDAEAAPSIEPVPQLPFEPEPREPRRTLPVVIVGDEELRSDRNWELRARHHVQGASNALCEQVGLALEVVEVSEWESPDDAPSLNAFRQEAMREWTRPDVLTIVFTAQGGAEGTKDDYDNVGVASYFSNVCVVRIAKHAAASSGYGTEILTHEILHCFGAWHVPGTKSVMRASVGGRERLIIGGVARQVIDLTWNMDFSRGIASIDRETQDEILALWRKSPLSEEDAGNPIAGGLLNRAWRLDLRGRGEAEQHACYWRVVSMYQERPLEVSAHSYAHSAHILASALLDDRRLDEVVRLLSRAVVVIDRDEIDDTPIGGARMQLGWAHMLRDEPGAALPHFRASLAKRLDRYGEDDDLAGESYDFIGRALRDLGELEGACEAFAEAVRIYTELDDPDLDFVTRQLQECTDLCPIPRLETE